MHSLNHQRIDLPEEVLTRLNKEGRELNTIEILFNEIYNYFEKFFPSLASLLNCSNDDHKEYRSFLSFFIGTVYSLIIFHLSFNQIENLEQSQYVILFSFVVCVIPISMVFFTDIRCIIGLSVFNFLASSARVTLTSIILLNILNGPIQNTFRNGHELAESLNCQYALFKNITKISKTKEKSNKHLVNSFRENSQQLVGQNRKVVDLNREIHKELTSPLEEETPSNHSSREEYRNNTEKHTYHQKNIERCGEILKSGKNACIGRLDDYCNPKNLEIWLYFANQEI